MKILEKINEDLKVTIIANLHHLEIANQYCHRIIGVNKGIIIFDGKPSELTNEIIEKIYEGEASEEPEE